MAEEKLQKRTRCPWRRAETCSCLADAMSQEQGNWDFVRAYWPQFTTWAEYLRDKASIPKISYPPTTLRDISRTTRILSIKAIEALASYAQMAQALGLPDVAKEYSRLAADMAAKWQSMAADGDHYKLAFDKPGTWSQKYNLVWDQILDLRLFPAQVRQTEVAFYLQHLNIYGLPLDNRRDYTKLDWEIWTATLADAPQPGNMPPTIDAFAALVAPIGRWINEGPRAFPSPTGTTRRPENRRAFKPAPWSAGSISRRLMIAH